MHSDSEIEQFSKLGLSEEQAVHRRVKAVLVYLAEQDKLGQATQ